MVGAGLAAQDYLEAFASSPVAELVAVADSDLEAAAHIGALLGCRVFDSHASLLRSANLDAVLITTPPASHAAIALDMLRCGIHVLCQKPLAVDVASARRMLLVAERAGVKLSMTSKFRYVGDVVQARALIASGLLGDVLTSENTFTSHVSMAGSWHANPAVSGGGVIIDKGTHALDLLRYMCGPVTAVAAYEGARAQHLPVEDTAHIVARTDRGVLGSMDLSWSCDQETDSYLRVCGTEGAISLGWARSKYCHGKGHSWISFGNGYCKRDALRDQLDNFCRSLRGEEESLISANDALASVETIAAAYRSLHCDRWVALDDATPGSTLELTQAGVAQ